MSNLTKLVPLDIKPPYPRLSRMPVLFKPRISHLRRRPLIKQHSPHPPQLLAAVTFPRSKGCSPLWRLPWITDLISVNFAVPERPTVCKKRASPSCRTLATGSVVQTARPRPPMFSEILVEPTLFLSRFVPPLFPTLVHAHVFLSFTVTVISPPTSPYLFQFLAPSLFAMMTQYPKDLLRFVIQPSPPHSPSLRPIQVLHPIRLRLILESPPFPYLRQSGLPPGRVF